MILVEANGFNIQRSRLDISYKLHRGPVTYFKLYESKVGTVSSRLRGQEYPQLYLEVS